MTDRPKTAHQKLEVLRCAYAAGLHGKLTELNAMVDSFVAAGTQEAANVLLEDLGAKAHQLAGSAGTFGFSNLGATAKKLELFCQALAVNKARPSKNDYQQIVDLMTLLQQSHEQGQDLDYVDPTPVSKTTRSKDQDLTGVQNILLVEDDLEQSGHLTVGIGAFGYAIKVIKKIEEIRTGIETYKPAAIILDLQFKEGRTAGAEMIQGVRASSGIGCPIIVLTVHDDFEARLAAVRANAEHFLTKPVTLAKIVHLLDSLTASAEAQPERVMVIDDDPDIRDYVQNSLQAAGMIVEVVADPTTTLEVIQDFSPELLLVDLQMPECNGKELASIIRQKPEHSGIPIVYLSGEKDTDVQYDAMSVGADDFLTKPINPRYLAPAVKLRVERFRLLRDLMARDSLTGLYNHATTRQLLETELFRARRSGTAVSFAMLDIDQFKAVNDTYGHITGDAVIKVLSSILTHRLRHGDVVGRLGGEEFGAVLADTPADQAYKVMESIRIAFEEISQNVAGSEAPITLSCGIAEYPIYESGVELSEAADRALYEAKNAGRNITILA